MAGACVAHLGHRGVLRLGFYLSEGSSVALLPVVDQLACDQAECLSLLTAVHEKSKGGGQGKPPVFPPCAAAREDQEGSRCCRRVAQPCSNHTWTG